MSLILCPECGKEISDKSEKCVHCGYPLKQDNICIVNGKEYDLSFLLDESYSTLYKVRDLIQISHSDISHVDPVVEKIIQDKKIPKFLNLPTKQQKESDILKCPTCNSTNLKKITLTSKAINTAVFGILGTKRHKTFHCNNCKYEW